MAACIHGGRFPDTNKRTLLATKHPPVRSRCAVSDFLERGEEGQTLDTEPSDKLGRAIAPRCVHACEDHGHRPTLLGGIRDATYLPRKGSRFRSPKDRAAKRHPCSTVRARYMVRKFRC